MSESEPTITSHTSSETALHKPVKTEVQISDQIGRITSKLVDRAERVAPLKEVSGATRWTYENKIKHGNMVITALKAKTPNIESIEVSEMTPKGPHTIHKSEVGYKFVRNGRGGNEQVFDSASTSSIESMDDGTTVEKHMHRLSEDKAHPEIGPSTHLTVSQYNVPGQGTPEYSYQGGEWSREAPTEVRQEAISTSASTLNHIRGNLALVDKSQAVDQPTDQTQSAGQSPEQYRKAA